MSETDEQRPTDHGGPWKIALGCYFAVFWLYCSHLLISRWIGRKGIPHG